MGLHLKSTRNNLSVITKDIFLCFNRSHWCCKMIYNLWNTILLQCKERKVHVLTKPFI